jgi:hypothetical protein
LIKKIDNSVSLGKVTEAEAAATKKFLGSKSHHLSVSSFV